MFQKTLVQMAGIEPAREDKSRRILSPVRLPVSPHLHICNLLTIIIIPHHIFLSIFFIKFFLIFVLKILHKNMYFLLRYIYFFDDFIFLVSKKLSFYLLKLIFKRVPLSPFLLTLLTIIINLNFYSNLKQL